MSMRGSNVTCRQVRERESVQGSKTARGKQRCGASSCLSGHCRLGLCQRTARKHYGCWFLPRGRELRSLRTPRPGSQRQEGRERGDDGEERQRAGKARGRKGLPTRAVRRRREPAQPSHHGPRDGGTIWEAGGCAQEQGLLPAATGQEERQKSGGLGDFTEKSLT